LAQRVQEENYFSHLGTTKVARDKIKNGWPFGLVAYKQQHA